MDKKKATTGWLNAIDPSRIKHTRGGSVSTRWPNVKTHARRKLSTVKDFVESKRGIPARECVFVPGALDGRPAQVTFCGKNISASRYMALLTHGAPKSEGMAVRHLCGNGHLSCINPNHVVWGTPGDNQSDANIHRGIGDDATAQDKINAARQTY